MQAMFRDAFNYLASHTCLKFEYNENPINSVNIQLGNACWSKLGMLDEQQDLSFAYHCAHFGVAVHEVMHALGIAQGQSRSDRNVYLYVDPYDHNDDLSDTINSVPFDYGSVMLYWRDERRYPKDPEYNYTMGSLRVAFYDMILLNEFYECNCDKHRIKLNCQNGGYQNPANCNECLCTDGFKGELCDKLDGFIFEAETEWELKSVSYAGIKGITRSTEPQNQYFHITAPEGSTIEVQIVRLEGFYCHDTCDWNGVELKYKTDRRIVSPLVCCDNDNLWNKTRSSTNNPFVIVEYGDNRIKNFTFQYRYLPGNATSSAP
uniref:Metalloendopeptidase n=1 Tax=Caenorhabditis tropicalis TaxID=1561998 RepID=A0A1I7UAX6_9PELO